jgi:sulfur-carrier protein
VPVTVRYFAGARAAAGVETEQVTAASLGELVDLLGATRGERMTTVLGACSFLVDGVAARDSAAALPDGATVDVLPPFAGG